MSLLAKISLSLLLPLLNLYIVRGQESFGALHGNYTPTNSIYINPSSILSSKVWLDINIAGFGFYSNNDLIYLNNHKWLPLVKKIGTMESELSNFNVDFNSGKEEYQGYNKKFVAGFSGVWSQQNQGVGISTGVRSYSDVRGVSNLVAYILEHETLPENSDIGAMEHELRVSSMHFGEIKGTYAYTFFKGKRSIIGGGVSVSRLFPIAVAGFNIKEFNYGKVPETSSLEYHLESEVMHTRQTNLKSKGGVGIDVGFSFQKMLNSARKDHPKSWCMGCQKDPYRYKIGVSIMDLGQIKFSENEIYTENYNFNDWIEVHSNDETSTQSISDAFEEHESTVDGNINDVPYKMSLPSFVSFQFDYNVWNSKVYINGTWIHGLTKTKNEFSVRHAHSISIVPRYETFLFEFSIPFSLYEYKQPQIGLSLRYGIISLGTDNLLNWLKNDEIYGADVYLYTKIPLRYRPKCKVGFKPKKLIQRTRRPKLLY